MFKSQMIESSTSKVKLIDIDSDTFHAMLLYIYTGKVEVNNSTSYTELVYGAENMIFWNWSNIALMNCAKV